MRKDYETRKKISKSASAVLCRKDRKFWRILAQTTRNLKYAPQILLCIAQMPCITEEKLNLKTRLYRWAKQQKGKETVLEGEWKKTIFLSGLFLWGKYERNYIQKNFPLPSTEIRLSLPLRYFSISQCLGEPHPEKIVGLGTKK